jgi:predicted cupin superfamily sugar epimerase
MEDYVKKYKMLDHPEGGYFVETYRSDTIIKNRKGKNIFLFMR